MLPPPSSTNLTILYRLSHRSTETRLETEGRKEGRKEGTCRLIGGANREEEFGGFSFRICLLNWTIRLAVKDRFHSKKASVEGVKWREAGLNSSCKHGGGEQLFLITRIIVVRNFVYI